MSTITKRDFGAFHVSNVQELINLADEEYDPPPFPEDIEFHLQSLKETSITLGRTARNEHFFIKDYTFINHGAFGGVLKHVLLTAQKWQMYIESQPVRFFDRELFPQLVYVTRRLASFVGCKARDLVLVQNVTTALNSILKSLPFRTDDIIFTLSIEYGAVKKMLEEVCLNSGAILQTEQVQFPVESKQQLLQLFEEKLHPDTKVVIFDHISSRTPFIMPVEDIASVCRRRCPDARIIVDGAHALLTVPLKVADLGVDYYVSNCHKWFSAPKGTAFMYVKPQYQSDTRPLVISHGWGSGFNSEYIWQGLRDYSGFLAIHAALDFWTAAGEETVRKHIYQLARDAANMLVEKWNSRKMASDELNGCMLCVQLPRNLYDGVESLSYNDAERIQNILYHRFQIEVPIKVVEGDLYVRISAHIYNELEEYETLASAVLTITEENVLSKS